VLFPLFQTGAINHNDIVKIYFFPSKGGCSREVFALKIGRPVEAIRAIVLLTFNARSCALPLAGVAIREYTFFLMHLPKPNSCP
jgi:hypothetical protein